jgi:hypothetical protein
MPEYPMPPYGVLPFHDPIARVITFHGRDYFIDMRHWSVSAKAKRALRRLARYQQKHGMYDDDF